MRKNLIVVLQILLLLSLTIIIPSDFKNFYGSNVVAASKYQEALGKVQEFLQNEKNKVNTCVELRDGSVCQQMPRYACEEACKSGCVEKSRDEVPECKLGTCIDEEEGICTPRTPISTCEEMGGNFDERELEDIEGCQKRCCYIGNQAKFITKKQCEVLAEDYQTDFRFDEEIASEFSCLLAIVEEAEGACVIKKEAGSEEPSCRRTNLEYCGSLGGEFHEKMLCSHPDLETGCEKQKSISCFSDLEEVYWIDSCENRENIFQSSESESWNNGFILAKNESCAMGSPGDWLKNQRSCGNCNRLRGSLCGNVTSEKKLIGAPEGDVICKDLACEVNGTRRENGETWCVYQNAIGTSLEVPLIGGLGYFGGRHIDGMHSMSAPGGRHFRQSCIEGEVVTEPCADYRNEICIESRSNLTSDGSKSFSIAACRGNKWSECLQYNANGGGPLSELLSKLQPIIDIYPPAGKALQGPLNNAKVNAINLMFKCEKNPDCYINSVSVGENYKFPLCLPKYPPGFYQQDTEGEDQTICGFGNQNCVSVWVFESIPFTFGLAAEWKCKAGCECVEGSPPGSAKGSWDEIYPSKKLAQQSQDICVSLGDCGKKANYRGQGGILDSGYKFKILDYEGMPKEDPDGKAKDVSKPKLLRVDDSKPIHGKYVDSDYEGLFGEVEWGEGEGEGGGIGPKGPTFKPADPSMALLAIGGVTGATALGVSLAANAGWLGTFTTTTATALGPSLAAFSNFFMGASIGAAITSLLVGLSPVGQGVGVGGSIAYGVAGGVAGGMIGAAYGANIPLIGGLFSSGAAAGGAAGGAPAWMGPAGITVLIIVIIDIITQWIMGVGSIRTVEAKFECGLWQPPVGTKEICESCGKQGLPCSKYACETLGKDCTFVMESEGFGGNGTNACIYDPKNDVNGPIIVNVSTETITKGFKYYNEELGKASSSFKIRKSGSDDGCVNQLESFGFGFEINEPGECRYAYEPERGFENMTQFGGRVMSRLHYDSFSMTEVPFEGKEEKEITMYIQCKDYSSGEEGGNIGEENKIGFCIDPIDITPPVVISENENNFIRATENSRVVRVEFNEEVSEARLGTTNGAYESLEYKMSCKGRVCSAEVPMNVGDNNFFVKAKDLQGNLNEEGHLIKYVRSESELEIDSISPGNVTIETGEIFNLIEIEITTGGGVDGKAECSFTVNNGQKTPFKETGGISHKQKLDRVSSGNYKLDFYCVDVAGNEASDSSLIKIVRDSIYPEITRVYDEGGTLVVITKEDATCSYKKDNCGFDVDEGILMGGEQKEHRTGLDYGTRYFIKCKDKNGNEPSDCNLIVEGSEF